MPKFITVLDGLEDFYENGYGKLKTAVDQGARSVKRFADDVGRNMADVEARQAEAERQAVQEIVRALTPQVRSAPAGPPGGRNGGAAQWVRSFDRGHDKGWENALDGKPPEKRVPKGESPIPYRLGESVGRSNHDWDEELSKGPDGFGPSQPSAPLSGGRGNAAGPPPRKKK